MWKELVARLEQDYSFHPPASASDIGAVARAVDCDLPADLVAALEESNGIDGRYGLGLIWSTEMMIEQNHIMRSTEDFKELYMPFDSFFFFADAGNGDLFAYTILAGEIRRDDIFAWNHENDSRQWVAPSLGRYIEWWLGGQIKL